ncbi:MAG: prolyl oligopeptidase family serine peptidase [Lutibacter sp.]|uniref:carboxylesterase family protein n=1 Tax=Lutibacter sp. TaxID=1925666 RepID=UPI00385E44B0
MSINKVKILIIISFIIFISSCKLSKKIEEQLLRIPYISSIDSTSRDYFVYLPKGYHENSTKKWPVLLFLHGNGERGNGKDELDYVLIHGPLYEAWIQKRDLPFIIIVPQLQMFNQDKLGLNYIDNRTKDWIPKRLKNGVPKRTKIANSSLIMQGTTAIDSIPNLSHTKYGWNKAENDLMKMIDNTLINFNADENRVYLSGISYGGFGTWYIASKHPKRFAAINPIVGWGHPILMDSIAKYKIPVWQFAGGRDQVIPVKYFYEGLNKLEKLGHKNIRFTIHEDLSHDTWKRIYEGNDIYNWLLDQKRK